MLAALPFNHLPELFLERLLPLIPWDRYDWSTGGLSG
jgi:hypothetical protein